LDPELVKLVKNVARDGRLVVVTGAGVSAASGIPTFRGEEGYWTVGSKEYRPEEMATWGSFQRMPDDVWQWYLYRLGVCRAAKPNGGHKALVEIEKSLGDRFHLVTQNVDGLHLRAGSTLKRTHQAHGNIEYMRCASKCTIELFPIPKRVKPKQKGEPLTKADKRALRCPKCGGRARPHILFFDECYDSFLYMASTLAAKQADLLITVGTSGAASLPMRMATLARDNGAVLADVNLEPNPFSGLAVDAGGFFCKGKADKVLTEIASLVKG
jgi:NAD-dependent deacetylase